MQPISSIIIQAESKDEFVKKIEVLLESPPDWVSKHVGMIRLYLDEVSSNYPVKFTYNPSYRAEGIEMLFNCTRNNFTLRLNGDESESFIQKKMSELLPKKESSMAQAACTEVVPQSSTYKGPLNAEAVTQFPSDLQDHAKKLAEIDFPYKVKITPDKVVVGGHKHFEGTKINISDLLKKQ